MTLDVGGSSSDPPSEGLWTLSLNCPNVVVVIVFFAPTTQEQGIVLPDM